MRHDGRQWRRAAGDDHADQDVDEAEKGVQDLDQDSGLGLGLDMAIILNKMDKLTSLCFFPSSTQFFCEENRKIGGIQLIVICNIFEHKIEYTNHNIQLTRLTHVWHENLTETELQLVGKSHQC